MSLWVPTAILPRHSLCGKDLSSYSIFFLVAERLFSCMRLRAGAGSETRASQHLVWVSDEWRAPFCNDQQVFSAHDMPGLALDQESGNRFCKKPDTKQFSFEGKMVSVVTTLLAIDNV